MCRGVVGHRWSLTASPIWRSYVCERCGDSRMVRMVKRPSTVSESRVVEFKEAEVLNLPAFLERVR